MRFARGWPDPVRRQLIVAWSIGTLTFAHVADQLQRTFGDETVLRLRLDRVESGLQWNDWVLVPFALQAAIWSKCAFHRLAANTHFYSNWGDAAGRKEGGHGAALIVQWLSGGIAVGFLALHLGQFRLARFTGRLLKADVYPLLNASISSTWAGIPLVALLYLVALAAACVFWTRSILALQTRLPSPPQSSWSTGSVIVLGWALFLLGALATVLRAAGPLLG